MVMRRSLLLVTVAPAAESVMVSVGRVPVRPAEPVGEKAKLFADERRSPLVQKPWLAAVCSVVVAL
jgi:hypothetical protein